MPKDHCLSFMTAPLMPTEICIWVHDYSYAFSGPLTEFTVGHALNKVLKDIINRYQVLQGRRVRCVTLIMSQLNVHLKPLRLATCLDGTVMGYPLRIKLYKS